MAQRTAKNAKRANSSSNIRPTSGKVLLALLNILQSSGHIDGCRFLDLFAGTGEVTIAAASRGAAFTLAVESDRTAASGIAARIASLPARAPAHVVRGDVRRIVPKLARECEADPSRKFDVIFADPPYCLGWGETLPGLIEDNAAILTERGVFVFEHSAREKPADRLPSVFARDDRIYGDTVLSFYRQRTEKREEGVF